MALSPDCSEESAIMLGWVTVRMLAWALLAVQLRPMLTQKRT